MSRLILGHIFNLMITLILNLFNLVCNLLYKPYKPYLYNAARLGLARRGPPIQYTMNYQQGNISDGVMSYAAADCRRRTASALKLSIFQQQNITCSAPTLSRRVQLGWKLHLLLYIYITINKINVRLSDCTITWVIL